MEKLFDAEFRLMEVLWEAEPINSTQLVHLCQEKLSWNKSTTYTVLRKLCQKGAAQNQNATVTTLLSRQQVIRARDLKGIPIVVNRAQDNRSSASQIAGIIPAVGSILIRFLLARDAMPMTIHTIPPPTPTSDRTIATYRKPPVRAVEGSDGSARRITSRTE